MAYAGAARRVSSLKADILSLGDDDLQRQVRGCDAVISCVGHVISLKGIYGPPRDLVTRATTRLCGVGQALRPAAPIGFILMSSASVHRPDDLDTRRGTLEKMFMWTLCRILPPAQDHQSTAHFLCRKWPVQARQHQHGNVAHFMCALATNAKTWDKWTGKMPVIINAAPR